VISRRGGNAGRMVTTRQGKSVGWRFAPVLWLWLVQLAVSQPALDLPDSFSRDLLSLPELPKVSLWDSVFTFQSSAGYKDNVALSAIRPSGSAFVRNQAEAIVFRMPVDGLEFNAFLTGEDTRFLKSDVVDKEQGALAYAQVKHSANELWVTSLSGQYIYQDQVVDLTTSLATPTVLAVQSHTYAARFAVRRKFAERWWWEVEPTFSRQDFNSPLDDYWEGGPRFSIGRFYGDRSELSASFELNYRPYDHREQFTSAGAAIAGTELAFTQQRVQLAWKHRWGAQLQWDSTTKLGYESSHDNGSGYYDFRKWQASQQLRWNAAPWAVSLAGRLSHFHYPRQAIGPADTRAIERMDFSLNLHTERALSKRVKWILDFDFDRSLANQPANGYSVKLFHSGVSIEF
jgi:hypothetical protein